MKKLRLIYMAIIVCASLAQAQSPKIVEQNYESGAPLEVRIPILSADSQSTGYYEFVKWYESGTRWLEGQYKAGKLDGIIVEYRQDLTKKSESAYLGGKKVKEILFDERGLQPLPVADSQKVLTRTEQVTLPSGLKVMKEGYDRKAGLFVNHGKSTVWYTDSTGKYEEGSFRYGQLHGLVIHWYQNKKKKFEGPYRDGKEDGIWLYWDEHGRLIEEILYKSGLPIHDYKF